MSVQPEGWPKPEEQNIKYCNSLLFHRGGDGVSEYSLPLCQLDKLEIFRVPPTHPAYPGRGVRAREVLKENEDVGWYAGFYRPGIGAPDNAYVFGLHPLEKDMVVDALLCGNITRYINDAKGTKHEANLFLDDMIIEHSRGIRLRTAVFRATKDIQPGEELLFEYEASVKGYWPTTEVIDLTTDDPIRIKREVVDLTGDEPTQLKRERDEEEEEDVEEDSDTGVMIICIKCQEERKITAYRARSRNHICNQCANKRRDSDPARYIARKLADRLRNQGINKPSHIGVEFARQVIEKCGGKSVISGHAELRHLCIIDQNPEKPLTLENAILVTGGESYQIQNERKKRK